MPAPQHYRTELSNIETQHKALRIAQPRSIPDELEQIGKSFARIEQIKAETSAHLAIVQSQQQTSKSSGSLWRLVGLGKSSSKSISEHDRKLMADYDAVNTQAIALQKLLEESRWEARAILNTSAENNRPESEQKRVNYHA